MKNNSLLRISVIAFLLVIISFTFFTPDLFARAGGGGDYGGGGGGDSDGGGIFILIYYIIMLIPFPFNIIAIAIVVVAFLYFSRKQKVKKDQKSIFNNIPTGNTQSQTKVQQSEVPLKYENSGDIKKKIEYAFIQIQKGWQNQDLSKVRKFISDGVYQRFNTQFTIMNILEQKNVIYDIRIHNISVVNIHEENEYAVVDAAIHATIVDQYKSDKYPQFNQGGSDTFVEYWSFIRKKNTEGKDLYFTSNCPKCGDQLPEDAGEVSKCPSCGTLTNSGDYDWVLAEITQTVDYNANGFKKGDSAAKKLLNVYAKDPSFSIQMMEDKASNAFLQILTARTKNKAETARRFVSDEYYTKLENEVKQNTGKAYVRLYLNHVDLVNGYSKDNMDYLIFNIKYTKQQIQLNGGKGTLLDGAPFSLQKVMVMCRATNATPAKGQLYAHSCPNCGGPITDTIDTKCAYCGELLNSPNFEWIVNNIYDPAEYKTIKAQLTGTPMVTTANPEDTEKLFKIRDYAFNNILIIMAADGEFKQEEKDYALKLAKQFKYNETQVGGWIDLAQQKKLSLIWPYEASDKKKVYEMMEKAAMADNELQPAEKVILDQAKAFLN